MQYVGRVLRAHDEKTDPEVHDYVDVLSPILIAMHVKRLPSYAGLGLDVRPQRRNVSTHSHHNVRVVVCRSRHRSAHRRATYGRAFGVVG